MVAAKRPLSIHYFDAMGDQSQQCSVLAIYADFLARQIGSFPPQVELTKFDYIGDQSTYDKFRTKNARQFLIDAQIRLLARTRRAVISKTSREIGAFPDIRPLYGGPLHSELIEARSRWWFWKSQLVQTVERDLANFLPL